MENVAQVSAAFLGKLVIQLTTRRAAGSLHKAKPVRNPSWLPPAIPGTRSVFRIRWNCVQGHPHSLRHGILPSGSLIATRLHEEMSPEAGAWRGQGCRRERQPGLERSSGSPVPVLLTGRHGSDRGMLRILARILSISTFTSFRCQADGPEGREEKRPPWEISGKAGSPGAPEMGQGCPEETRVQTRGHTPANLRSWVWLMATRRGRPRVLSDHAGPRIEHYFLGPHFKRKSEN